MAATVIVTACKQNAPRKFVYSSFLLASLIGSSCQVYAEERIKNVEFITRSSIILMPCMDKSGNQMMGGPTKNEFCTEVFNQLVRDGGAKTVSWFKVNSALQKVVKGSQVANANPFLSGSSMGGPRIDYTNDMYIPELITASRTLGARYIVRPVVLNKDSTQSSDQKVKMGFMGFGAGVERKTTKTANVTIKIDVISVSAEDIVASRSFSGDVNSTKKSGAGYELSGFGGYGGMDAGTRAAMTDAIYKSVEYLADRVD
tara:strand:+ start:212 stop:985 length:774 start_codon:yes stop_codon:yes gene_type:complete